MNGDGNFIGRMFGSFVDNRVAAAHLPTTFPPSTLKLKSPSNASFSIRRLVNSVPPNMCASQKLTVNVPSIYEQTVNAKQVL